MLAKTILIAVVRDGIIRPTVFVLLVGLSVALLVALTGLALTAGTLAVEFVLEVTGTPGDHPLVGVAWVVLLIGSPTFGWLGTSAVIREIQRYRNAVPPR